MPVPPGHKTLSTNERDLIVGGQAVIEGVMMRTPNAYAIAVRKADGTIVNTAAVLPKWSDKYPLLKLPILRGGAVLVQSMGLGVKAGRPGSADFCASSGASVGSLSWSSAITSLS